MTQEIFPKYWIFKSNAKHAGSSSSFSAQLGVSEVIRGAFGHERNTPVCSYYIISCPVSCQLPKEVKKNLMGLFYLAKKGCEPRGSGDFCYKCRLKGRQSERSCFSSSPAPFKPAGIYVEYTVRSPHPRPPEAVSVSSSFLTGDGKMKRCTAKYKLANSRLVVSVLRGSWGGGGRRRGSVT